MLTITRHRAVAIVISACIVLLALAGPAAADDPRHVPAAQQKQYHCGSWFHGKKVRGYEFFNTGLHQYPIGRWIVTPARPPSIDYSSPLYLCQKRSPYPM